MDVVGEDRAGAVVFAVDVGAVVEVGRNDAIDVLADAAVEAVVVVVGEAAAGEVDADQPVLGVVSIALDEAVGLRCLRLEIAVEVIRVEERLVLDQAVALDDDRVYDLTVAAYAVAGRVVDEAFGGEQR